RARTRVHRVPGTRTPDHRTRAVELTMPADQVLDLARAEGVSLTMYLTALFVEAVRASSGGLGAARTVAVSVPVNLRQFFPSTSARNFFATVRVAHTYGEGDDGLGAVARRLDGRFRPQVAPAALERKLRRFIRFERMPLLRILPRPLKDLVLRLVNSGNNRGLTLAVSNLGRVTLPEPAASHVGRVLFQVSAVRPQFCAISHAGRLTVTFTSPFVETGHIRDFTRMLTAQGVDVDLAAAAVTEAELAQVQP
ncbi:MAG TPA: alcohol acetyltransferase, partial [Citricoccus sp.]